MHSALRIPGHDPGHGPASLLITECYKQSPDSAHTRPSVWRSRPVQTSPRQYCACCLLFVAWVFRPFAMEHPETAWALLEMMVQRVRDAEAR